MTLRDQIEEVIELRARIWRVLEANDVKYLSDNIETIADNFAIAFAEWLAENHYNRGEARDFDIDIKEGEWLETPYLKSGKLVIKTTAELLQHFKDNVYGKGI